MLSNITDVLIIGSGPSGLMLAAQLSRFNIAYRILDKGRTPAKESRAFGIQAKTMEILQNLGLAEEFLQNVIKISGAQLHFSGKQRVVLDFNNIEIHDTPFPAIYFLPQSTTEALLVQHLANKDIQIERQKKLLAFDVLPDQRIQAVIYNEAIGCNEEITCRYLIACDGAHSKVREILNIPFIGASYPQEFVLADITTSSFTIKDKFMVFMGKTGMVLILPISTNIYRFIIIGMENLAADHSVPSKECIQDFVCGVTQQNIIIDQAEWISRFHLDHRIVKDYQYGNIFLVGDAAHVHSPVGAQGMNTGIQDATNLAWKLAFTLRYQSNNQLLATYQLERKRIGEILVRNTDAFFGILIKNNFLIRWFRLMLLPLLMKFVLSKQHFRRRLFYFVSQLRIHYHVNAYIKEDLQDADQYFKTKLKVGERAPDVSFGNVTLFDLLRQKPCCILIFHQNDLSADIINKLDLLRNHYVDVVGVNFIKHCAETNHAFASYGVNTDAIYFIRPDGYIGYRAYGLNKLNALIDYCEQLCGVKA